MRFCTTNSESQASPFGANILDLLARYTHPILDVIAWLPYGVGHFTVPFIVTIFLWLFRRRPVPLGLRVWLDDLHCSDANNFPVRCTVV